MTVENITEMERGALLPDIVNLSDGHARQSLGEKAKGRAREVVNYILSTGAHDYFAAEKEFLDCLTAHNRQRYRAGQFYITYSSSVAMTMIAAQLKQERRRVGVLCPIFDNIPGILQMTQVPIVPVMEEWLTPAVDFERLESLDLGALVLVVPNNPTATSLHRDALCELLDWAARRRVELVFDLAFRWFEPGLQWDLIAEADARGADVVTIDDTGKILALADQKVGVLSASRSLSQRLQFIHDQYVLNVSELTLRLLAALMESDEIERAIQLVGRNCGYLDSAVIRHNATTAVPVPRPSNTAMSVQWLCLPGDRDQILADCRARGLEILPGRNFYWSLESGGAHHVRLAMMRDPAYFAAGTDILLSVLRDRTGSADITGRR